MDQRVLLTLIALASLCAGGCSAGGRVVRRDATGGELALWGPIAPATLLARELIVEHCGGRYRLLAEGSPQAANALSGRAQVSYECIRSQMAASSAVQPAPASAEAASLEVLADGATAQVQPLQGL